MIYLQLFLSFMKIGFSSFGGMSMIPLILEEMQIHGWMTSEDLSNLVAIAEMTPGPLGINCATFTGTQTAGLLGGIIAVLGVLTPAFSLTLLVAVFFEKFKDSAVVRTIMRFVKPVCIAMLMGAMATLGRDTFWAEGSVLPFSVLISALMMFILVRYKWSVPKVIISSACLGLLFYGLLPLMRAAQ